MDSIEDIDNSELIKIIEDLQIEPEIKTPDMLYDTLLNTQLLIPAIIKNDNKIDIIKIKNRKGEEFLAGFTDKKNLNLNSEPADGVVFTMENYLEVIKSNSSISGIVINPYSNNLVLTRSNLKYIENLLNIKKNNEIVVGLPSNYPQNLVDTLSEYFESNTEIGVKKAFLLQIIKANQPSLLIVVDVDIDEESDFLQKLGSITKPLLVEDQVADLILFDNDFGRDITSGYDPFYIK